MRGIKKPWMRGALLGGAIGLLTIFLLFIIGSNKAFVVLLFYPDFIIAGAVVGYLHGRFNQKEERVFKEEAEY